MERRRADRRSARKFDRRPGALTRRRAERRERTIEPRSTGANETLRELAVKNGCKPEWADGMLGWAWHCGCPDGLHQADQQCSVITMESARRKR